MVYSQNKCFTCHRVALQKMKKISYILQVSVNDDSSYQRGWQQERKTWTIPNSRKRKDNNLKLRNRKNKSIKKRFQGIKEITREPLILG